MVFIFFLFLVIPWISNMIFLSHCHNLYLYTRSPIIDCYFSLIGHNLSTHCCESIHYRTELAQIRFVYGKLLFRIPYSVIKYSVASSSWSPNLKLLHTPTPSMLHYALASPGIVNSCGFFLFFFLFPPIECHVLNSHSRCRLSDRYPGIPYNAGGNRERLPLCLILHNPSISTWYIKDILP